VCYVIIDCFRIDEKEKPNPISEREEDNISAASSDSYRFNDPQSSSQPADSKSGKLNPDTSSTGGEDEDEKELEEDEDEEPSSLGEMVSTIMLPSLY
jgi:hypothetical protein